jgi:triphosphatase
VEVELKFQVPAAQVAGLERAIRTSTAQTVRLQAVYADTAGHALAAASLALRLRLEGRTWVQTLKGRGDGLMSRLEHEVVLPPQRGRPELDPQRHAGTAVGDRLLQVLGGRPLQPLYRTDVRRLQRVLRWQGAQVEVALDRGWLIGGPAGAERRLKVQEVEFELKRGSPHQLPALTLRWLARHGLWWDSRTKSERGMRLALGLDRVPAQPLSPLATPRSLRAWQAAVSATVAHAMVHAAEIGSGLDTPDHHQQLQLALDRLQRLFGLVAAGPLAEPAAALAKGLAGLRASGAIDATQTAWNALMLAALTLTFPLPPA